LDAKEAAIAPHNGSPTGSHSVITVVTNADDDTDAVPQLRRCVLNPDMVTEL
jgi:hypothetical protein